MAGTECVGAAGGRLCIIVAMALEPLTFNTADGRTLTVTGRRILVRNTVSPGPVHSVETWTDAGEVAEVYPIAEKEWDRLLRERGRTG